MNLKQNEHKSVLELFKKSGLLIILFILLLGNLIVTPNFGSIDTAWNIVIQITPIMLTSLGMTLVIATGGIDISIGACMALVSIISAKYLGLGIFPAIALALIFATLFGMFNGFVISRYNLQPIVVTLSTMIAGRGIAQVLNDGKLLNFVSPEYSAIGNYRFFSTIPVQFVIMLVAITILYLATTRMRFGYYLNALGDNKKAAKLTGVKTTQIIITVYALSAIFAAIAGVIGTARISAADASSIGKLIELDAIAAVTIGGTNMNGGKPKILGTVIGAIIIQLISVSIIMNNVPFNYSLVLKSIIIIVAVYVQRKR